ncbi:2TM domain-containing protein [Janibacter alittae]|uniref:2TM domain-containing protein n=1 Tax=Janibacter alittae TaxID=3115209 RepID=A0ABZ2MFK6_9MICO
MGSSSDQFDPRREATSGESEDELRTRALNRLKAKKALAGHVVLYVAVNLMLVVIWWVTGAGFFWPAFPLLGWGIGLAYNAWEVMSPQPGPDAIRAEMDRLRNRQN